MDKILSRGALPDSDEVVNLYSELTDDLSYARTFFPNSQTTLYLNSLASKAYSIIHSQSGRGQGKIIRFFTHSYPLLFRSVQREVGLSFVVMLLAALLGWFSVLEDDTFVRLVMGDQYVDTTIQNILSNDPLAVYKQSNGITMFLGIAVNNIWVSFLAFLLGLLTPIGTGYILFRNGVMLGSFLAFFKTYNLTLTAVVTISIHGIPEIFAIVVAGGAGIVLGKGLMYPGVLTRLEAFRVAAVKATKLIAGLIPVFIYAALLEGFVTRHTMLPVSVKIAIIILSVVLIGYYFFIYPELLTRKLKIHGNQLHRNA